MIGLSLISDSYSIKINNKEILKHRLKIGGRCYYNKNSLDFGGVATATPSDPAHPLTKPGSAIAHTKANGPALAAYATLVVVCGDIIRVNSPNNQSHN